LIQLLQVGSSRYQQFGFLDIFDAVRLAMKMFTSDKRMILVEHGHLSIVFESNESQYILIKENLLE